MMQTDTISDPIQLSEPQIGSLEREWINRCLDSGFVSTVGEMIAEFENRFAERVGARYAVATATGTAALHLAMRLSGIEPGDVIAIQDLTFVASVNPALQLKAEPLLVDVDPVRWCLDVALLEQFFEEHPVRAARIKVVVPVHLYGCAADMPRLMNLADRFGFRVIEDATEALGTTLHSKQVGTFGDFGCFSFNGNKMMTTGAGGMLVTESAKMAKQARYLLAQAREPGAAYVHGTDGYNYRMTNLNAALGLAQLERLDLLIEKKRQIARDYRKAFAGSGRITLPAGIAGLDNCYWLSSLLMESQEAKERLLAALNAARVMARPFFTPLHSQPYLYQAEGLWTGDWIGSDLAGRGLNLPSSALMLPAQQQRVIDRVLAWIA